MSTKCKDHLGNEFESIRNMCIYWNINENAYYNRIHMNWSLKDTLTTPVGFKFMRKYKDHLGNEFPSENEMCEYWNIQVTSYRNRKKMGWDLEKSLTVPVGEHNKCIDHLGNEFKSEKEMCEYWKVPVQVFINRKRSNWDLEKALTTSTPAVKLYFDNIRNINVSSNNISEFYNISRDTFTKRLKTGYHSFAAAVDVSFIIRPKGINIDETKYNLTVSKRIKKDKDVFECYINNDDGTSTFKIMTYDMIDQYCIDQYKKLHNII